jgi:hypothetical protein
LINDDHDDDDDDNRSSNGIFLFFVKCLSLFIHLILEVKEAFLESHWNTHYSLYITIKSLVLLTVFLLVGQINSSQITSFLILSPDAMHVLEL